MTEARPSNMIPSIILVVYYAVRWLGLLPPRLLPILDPVMGALVFALTAAIGLYSSRGPGVERGLAIAFASAAGLAAAGLAVGAATGLAVNPSIAAGNIFWQAVLVLPRLLGEAAAAAAAAAGGPAGAPLAVAIYLAPRVSLRELSALAAGLLGPGLFASTVLPYGLLGLTVYTVSARMGALGATALGFLVAAVPYMSPLLPSMGSETYGLLMILATTPILLYTQQPSPPRSRWRENGGWKDVVALGTVALLALALMKNGIYMLLVATGSMEPTINPGDLVIVVKASPNKIKIGDVVAYVREDGYVVLHRVSAIERRGDAIFFTTKGDANQEPDKQWNSERLLGRLALRIPKVGVPMLWMAKATGTTITAPVIAVTVTAIAAAARRNYTRRRRIM